MRLQIQAFVNHQANKLGEEGYTTPEQVLQSLNLRVTYHIRSGITGGGLIGKSYVRPFERYLDETARLFSEKKLSPLTKQRATEIAAENRQLKKELAKPVV